jgi:hypothetical protein
MRDLFSTAWNKRPITTKPYFDWHLLENYKGRAIAFCADSKDRTDILAGVSLVIPTILLAGGSRLNFSTALYGITHPAYYKKGIFRNLAQLTYDRCSRIGIMGTVGVPNHKSLPVFSKRLGFDVIGQFELMVRLAPPFKSLNQGSRVKRIHVEQDLDHIQFTLDQRKANSGINLGERTAEFIRWRFLRCPAVSYYVFVALGPENSVNGLIVFRTAIKNRIPVTVIVDFLVDHTLQDCDLVAKALLTHAYRHAWKTLTPLVVTLVAPSCPEARLLRKNGFRVFSKKLLPHDSNFIIKVYSRESPDLINTLHTFDKWYFSFADYDIF